MSIQTAAVRVIRLQRNIDAVTLLKADHRYIEDLLFEIKRAQRPVQKQLLGIELCTALLVHKDLEQELFYPAFVLGTQNHSRRKEVIPEYEHADQFLAQIMDVSAEDELFDANIHVLSQMMSHHVREEERVGGTFSTARNSKMDLMALGQALQRRRSKLLGLAVYAS